MRTILTFIVRLLVDPAEPKELHGALQSVMAGEVLPFADGQTLLALLQRLAERAAAETSTALEPARRAPD